MSYSVRKVTKYPTKSPFCQETLWLQLLKSVSFRSKPTQGSRWESNSQKSGVCGSQFTMTTCNKIYLRERLRIASIMSFLQSLSASNLSTTSLSCSIPTPSASARVMRLICWWTALQAHPRWPGYTLSKWASSLTSFSWRITKPSSLIGLPNKSPSQTCLTPKKRSVTYTTSTVLKTSPMTFPTTS